MLFNADTFTYRDESFASYLSVPFRCHHCNKQSDVAEDFPIVCDQCKTVRYCCEDHERRGSAHTTHQVMCHQFAVARTAFQRMLMTAGLFVEEQFQLEEVQILFRTLDIPASQRMQYVRQRPAHIPLYHPNAELTAWADAPGQPFLIDPRFEDGGQTITQMYRDLSNAIRQLGTREAYGLAALLSATEPRLDRQEPIQRPAVIAPGLLLSDHDQECYDLCKYIITKKHRQTSPPLSFLSATGQDIFEDVDFCTLDWETPYYIVPLFFLKFKLLLDMVTIHAVRRSFKHRLPEEITQLIFSSLALRSPLTTKTFVKFNERQRSSASQSLKKQVVQLGQLLQRECCFFTPILLLELLDVMGPYTGMCLHLSCVHVQPRCEIDHDYLQQGYYIKAALSFGNDPWHRMVGALELMHQVEHRVSKKQGRKPVRAYVSDEDYLSLRTRRPLLLKLGIKGAQDYFAEWWDHFDEAVDEELSM